VKAYPVVPPITYFIVLFVSSILKKVFKN